MYLKTIFSISFILIVYYLNKKKSLLYRLYTWNRPIYFTLKTIVTLSFLFALDSLRMHV